MARVRGSSLRSLRSTNGSVLPLALIVIGLMFVPIIALLIGLSFLLSDQTKLQGIANAAALAALDQWSRDTNSNLGTRAADAAARAGTIVAKNSMYSVNLSNVNGGTATVVLSGSASTPSSVGDVRFGQLFEIDPSTDPDPAQHPCSNTASNYPCFIPLDPTDLTNSDKINAAQVRLKTPINSGLVFFSRQFTVMGSTIAANATASVFNRCVTFLLDVSQSTVDETHDMNYNWKFDGGPTTPAPSESTIPASDEYWIDPPASTTISKSPSNKLILETPTIGAFGYRQTEIKDLNCDTDLLTNSSSDDKLFWCNMRRTRPTSSPTPDLGDFFNYSYKYAYPDQDGNVHVFGPTKFNVPTDISLTSSKLHYQSDYADSSTGAINTVFGPVIIDHHVSTTAPFGEPEPLTAFLDGFNSALRVIQNQRVVNDRVTIKAFTGGEILETDSVLKPAPGTTTSNFTVNANGIKALITATNVDNRGSPTLTPVSGNFVEKAWFPMNFDSNEPPPSGSGPGGLGTTVPPPNPQYTNTVQIIYKSIQQLDAVCPANAQKQIIIATDGIPTCKVGIQGVVAFPNDYDKNTPITDQATCDQKDYSVYQDAEGQLLGRALISGYTANDDILDLLISKHISLSVMLAGSDVNPNFNNIVRPDATCGTETGGTPTQSCYLSYAEAQQKGTCKGKFNDCNFFNADYAGGATSNEDAYINAGVNGKIFGRPNLIFGYMAMKTGGVFCPLQPQDPSSGTASTVYKCTDPNGGTDATDKRLCDQSRTGTTQYTSVYDRTLSEQAAACAFQVVGNSPYWLSEPLTRCAAGGTGCNSSVYE